MQAGTVDGWKLLVYREFTVVAGGGAFSSLLIQSPHGKNIPNLATQKKEARANTRIFETHGDTTWSQTSWST